MTYESALRHLDLLSTKRATLHDRQMDAERQLLHRIACDYAAGQIDMDDLARVYTAYRDVSAPGFAARWDQAIPVSAPRIRALIKTGGTVRPNGADGTWHGTWPFRGGPTPPRGAAVAYVLFDAADVPCYIGSTGHLRARFGQHRRAGKQFTRWVAYPCKDRGAAYAYETHLFDEYMPYLNRATR